MRRRLWLQMAAVLASADCLGAQARYPVQPVKIIASQAAGGGVDLVSRFMGALPDVRVVDLSALAAE